MENGCKRKLAPGQWWVFCGETDMGQSLPALCNECGGEYKLAEGVLPKPIKKLEHGYYWLELEGEYPEVVEIDGCSMYRCGSDITCTFENGKWIEYNEEMDVISITGPIISPNKTNKPRVAGES